MIHSSRAARHTKEASSADSAFQEFAHDKRTWRVVFGHEARIDPSQFDWFNLVEGPNATLVKRNSQRDVWRVTRDGRTYFAKLYHPRGAMARFKLMLRGPIALQEWAVGLYAKSHGIATVVPAATAWSGSRMEGGTSLLVTEAVDDALPLNDYWRTIRRDRVQADHLMDSLARLISRAHQCGFQHGDMHPGNILVRRAGARSEVFFVDLHRVHVERRVTPRQAVANLAQLNQWFRRNATRAQRLRFLRRYIDYRDQFAQASSLARNWRIDIRRLAADLAVQADRHANKLWAKRDRRVSRDSRYFMRIRPAPGWRGHVMLLNKSSASAATGPSLSFTAQQWKQWLADPLSWVRPAGNNVLKDSHSAMVCRGQLGDGPAALKIVAKRPLPRNGWKKLTQLLGRSRNVRNWKVANMLRNRDLPVAQPLAVVERWWGGIVRVDSVGLTEFIEGQGDLESFLTREVARLPSHEQRAVKNRLIDSVSKLLKAFHDRGFVHRDMKAPNLMVTWPAPHLGAPVLTFIDMDGIFHRRRSTERQRLRAVVRLCVSLLNSPACTSSDKLRFLKSYMTGPGSTAMAWKAYWRQINQEVCTKLHDKQLRRDWKLAHYGRE